MPDTARYPAAAARRFEVFSGTGYLPLGHPEYGLDAESIAAGVEAVLDSSHPDDNMAATLIAGRFRWDDADHVPTSLPEQGGLYTNVLEWIARADPALLNQFLAWNVERHAEHQRRLRAEIFDLQGTTLAHAETLTNYGLLYSGMPDKLQMALGLITYRSLDTFTSGGLLLGGSYNRKTQLMSLRNMFRGGNDGFMELKPEAQRLHTHESLHALHALIGGGLGIIDPATPNQPITTWVDEAYEEHSAQAAIFGQPEVMAPSERMGTTKGAYLLDRELLALVSEIARPAISTALWGEASAEPLSADRRPARMELQRRLGALTARLFPEAEGTTLVHVISEDFANGPTMYHDLRAELWLDVIRNRM